MRNLVNGAYATARTIRVVLVNLKTHFRSSFEQVLGVETARQILARIEFHAQEWMMASCARACAGL